MGGVDSPRLPTDKSQLLSPDWYPANYHERLDPGLRWRPADDPQPLHPAGAALCICPVGPAVPQQRPADARGHGGVLCRGGQPGRHQRQLGGAGQPDRSPAGPSAAGRLRPGLAVSGPGRSAQPALGAAGQSPLPAGRSGPSFGPCGGGLAAAGGCDRPALGPLRRPDPGADPHGGGHRGRQWPLGRAAAGLRPRGRHLTWPSR